MTEGASHDLHDFMAQVSDEMAAEYDRIRKRTQEDPGTAGDQGEENWAALLREWLPSSYHIVTKGRLIGHDGQTTPQMDVLVLKPAYPKKLLDKKLYLADGVAAAFECKTTLRACHIDKAVSNSVAAKRTLRQRTGTPYKELRSSMIFGLLAHSHEWKSPGSDPVKNIDRQLYAADAKHVDHPRLGIDLVCVADLATFNLMTSSYYDRSWRAKGQVGIVATTAMTAATPETEHQTESFRPIGAYINHLAQKLAWEDAALRDFADYYRLANLGGSAAGVMREWPMRVFSDPVAAKVSQGRINNGESFDEWNIVFP